MTGTAPRSGTCREFSSRPLRRRWLNLFTLEDRNATGSLFGDPLMQTFGDLLPLLGDYTTPAKPIPSRRLPDPLHVSLLTERDSWLDPLALVPADEPDRKRPSNAVSFGFASAAKPFTLDESNAADMVSVASNARLMVEIDTVTASLSGNTIEALDDGRSASAIPTPDSMKAISANEDNDALPTALQNQIEFGPDPIPNAAPVAATETVTVDEDSSIVIDVLANDNDPDGGGLLLELGDYETSHGTIYEEDDGKVRYTPFPDYHGPDSFTYQASDGVASSSMVTVSITVNSVNDAPAAFNDGYAWGLAVDSNDNFINLPTGMGHGPGYFAENLLANDIDWDWHDYVPPTPGYPPSPPGYPPPPPPPGSSKDVLRPFLETQPSIGTVNLFPNGVFYYMYPQNKLNSSFESFVTSFTYFVRDNADAKSNTATVTMWIKKKNDFTPTTSPTHPEYVVGDDPVEANAPGSAHRFLMTHPSLGRMNQFEIDGDFKYTPRYERNDEQFQYKVITPGGTNYSFVSAKLPALEMKIYDGQNGPKSLRELNELDTGAFTVANLNDTDSDRVRDDLDPVVSKDAIPDRNDPKDGLDEVDLMKIVILKPNVEGNLGTLTLRFTQPGSTSAGTFYSSSNPDLTNSTLTYVPDPLNPFARSEVTFNDASFRNADNTYKASITVYAELRVESTALRDYTIELSYGGATDKAKATGVWAELTQFKGGAANDTNLVTANAQSPRSVKDYDATLLANSPNRKMGTDNVPFGNATRQMVYNLVELEFTLTPSGISKIPRLGFDASRQVEGKLERNRQGGVDPLEKAMQLNRDRANDDAKVQNVTDEVQIGDKFYSLDAPGFFAPNNKLPLINSAARVWI